LSILQKANPIPVVRLAKQNLGKSVGNRNEGRSAHHKPESALH